jgi:hypothetical protein
MIDWTIALICAIFLCVTTIAYVGLVVWMFA